MRLYLLRHGVAAERGTGGFTNDAARPLTERGKEKMRLEAAGMRALGLSFDLILTSPLLRARQTAQIVADAYGRADDVEIVPALAPGDGFAETLDAETPLVRALGGYQFASALLVGHEPDLSALASLLLTGALGLNLQFKQGALCAIQTPGLATPDRSELIWLLAPKQLRALAGPAA